MDDNLERRVAEVLKQPCGCPRDMRLWECTLHGPQRIAAALRATADKMRDQCNMRWMKDVNPTMAREQEKEATLAGLAALRKEK